MSASPDAGRGRRNALAEYFSARWAGRAPLARVLWQDMLVVGTVINIVSAVAGLAVFASEAPTALGLVLYLAPLPYNVFLCMAVWRSAERAGARGALARWVALAWLAVMLIV